MNLRKHGFSAAVLFTLVAFAGVARAEEPQLHYGQSGALLAYADAEGLILYGALLAKEYDPELANATLGELERTLADAKRSADRAQVLLGDEKLSGDFSRLFEALKRAEAQIAKLKADFEQETGTKEPEPSDHKEEEPEAPKQRNWSLLKTGTAWLYADIKDARALHATLGKRLLVGGALRPPPRPTGKR